MDVRSARDVAPVVEHAGTVPVWWLIQPGELKEVTRGGFLELVSEWEVAGGGLVDPHSHPTHEFYYIISGLGVMKIADDEREVGQGDLIRIPPDVVHSIWPLTANSGSAGWHSPSGSRERIRSTTRVDNSSAQACGPQFLKVHSKRRETDGPHRGPRAPGEPMRRRSTGRTVRLVLWPVASA